MPRAQHGDAGSAFPFSAARHDPTAMFGIRPRACSAPAVLVVFSVLVTAALTALLVALPELATAIEDNPLFRLAG
jgi:hypothetical protein